MSETEMKLFQPLKEFWNYFSIVSATLDALEKKYTAMNTICIEVVDIFT